MIYLPKYSLSPFHILEQHWWAGNTCSLIDYNCIKGHQAACDLGVTYSFSHGDSISELWPYCYSSTLFDGCIIFHYLHSAFRQIPGVDTSNTSSNFSRACCKACEYSTWGGRNSMATTHACPPAFYEFPRSPIPTMLGIISLGNFCQPAGCKVVSHWGTQVILIFYN